ncbi:hypothetical protein CISG_01121 [Coccidioides immitis RMSCC 3703]|uniref:HNH nuclease domain-containing protein n=2 Tax=Coccidioides immitis TaxID=5501 RepID=A0A0J8TRL9_COCIT|nr:hypothetical protein CIRG_01776 [Coccidioides immitis RMSCC 2394]KMU76387.1 hypothetical protein CISG_01121 [Coccidioides immitis RMSCC 3703]
MTAHHRRQASLEQVLDFSAQPSLTAAELAQADDIFNKLISHCEPFQSRRPYKKVTLVRLTYEHSRSKDTFLRHFFIFLDTQSDQGSPDFARGLSRFSTFGPAAPAHQKREAEGAIDSFAEYLFDNFFLPLKASGTKTPQPTPAGLSASSIENAVGTPARLSVLRHDCLIRDHNQCVVTRVFNWTQALERLKQDPSNPKDDDGQQLIFAPGKLALLEVAHIIPHSIMSTTATVSGELQLSESRKTALAILNMFDPGVIHLIEGPNIDHPSNALTLTAEAHRSFGNFQISFEAMDTSIHPKHTYKIHSSDDGASLFFNLPAIRTLLLSTNHTIDPPSPKLLAIHRAIAVILHLSAAGEHIDQIIRHIEEVWFRSDGSAELGHIVSLKLGGWLDWLPSPRECCSSV